MQDLVDGLCLPFILGIINVINISLGLVAFVSIVFHAHSINRLPFMSTYFLLFFAILFRSIFFLLLPLNFHYEIFILLSLHKICENFCLNLYRNCDELFAEIKKVALKFMDMLRSILTIIAINNIIVANPNKLLSTIFNQQYLS